MRIKMVMMVMMRMAMIKMMVGVDQDDHDAGLC